MSKIKDTINLEEQKISIEDLINSFPNYDAIERMGAERKKEYSLSK